MNGKNIVAPTESAVATAYSPGEWLVGTFRNLELLEAMGSTLEGRYYQRLWETLCP
jgi:hypothetical protein